MPLSDKKNIVMVNRNEKEILKKLTKIVKKVEKIPEELIITPFTNPLLSGKYFQQFLTKVK